jgi:hypothetical protein
VGFSNTFMQVFASMLSAKYLRRHSKSQILMIFGGSSMALPEASQVMALGGIEGLTVAGPGEAPLGTILDLCLASASDSCRELVESIVAENITNVTQIGSQPKPVQLGSSQDLESRRFPNYDEYFAKWRSLCADNVVYQMLTEPSRGLIGLPMAGSRGCFAKCDFCQIPNITTQFTTLKGKTVFSRTVELSEKYLIESIVFIDSVCNTWAEEYADAMLATNRRFRAFMEMRAHCEESTWAKLALSGVVEVQLGIEALSDPLLRRMRKGTTAMQNVRASKHLAELGIVSLSNLITYHPRSVAADVEETRRVLSLTSHFPRLQLSEFALSFASPIYNELNEEQRALCSGTFRWLPAAMQGLSFPRALSYEYPREWLDSETTEAWDEFHAWYETEVKATPVFQVMRIGEDELAFVDNRDGKTKSFHLRDTSARVFNDCHTDRTCTQIARLCGLDEDTVAKILVDLTERGLLIEIGNRYLSLALRSREELIKNYYTRNLRPAAF